MANISLGFSDQIGEVGKTTVLNITSDVDITGLELADFTVLNGTLSNLQGSGKNWSATLTFPPAGYNTTTVILAENSVNEGNSQVVAEIPYYGGDVVIFPVSIRLTFSEPTGVAGRTTTLTLSLSGASSFEGLELGDFTVTNGTLSNLQWDRQLGSATLTFPASGSGETTVVLAANSIDAGNPETTARISYTAAPTPVEIEITSNPTQGVAGETARITIRGDKNYTGLALGDFTVTNGELSDLIGSGRIYVATLTFPDSGPGETTIVLAANSVSDGNAEVTLKIPFTAAPLPDPAVITLSVPGGVGIAGRTTVLSIESDIDITGLELTDFNIPGQTETSRFRLELSNLQGSGKSYTADVSIPNTLGAFTIVLPENSVNERNAQASVLITFVAPAAIRLSFSDFFGVSEKTTTLNIQSDKTLTGLALNDFTVTNGVLSDLEGTGGNYTATLTFPSGEGTTTVILSKDAVAEGNDAVQATINYAPEDPEPPEPSTEHVTLKEVVVNRVIRGGPFDITLIFSVKNAPGFGADDITVTGGSITSFSRGPDDWRITGTVNNNADEIVFTIRENAFENKTNDVITFRLKAVRLNIRIETGYPNRYVGEGANRYNVFFRTNAPALLPFNQITVNGASVLNSIKVSPVEYHLEVQPPNTGSGTISVSVPANVEGQGNAAVSATFNYTNQVQRRALFNWNNAIPGLDNPVLGSSNRLGPRAGIVVEGGRIRLFACTNSNRASIYSLTLSGQRRSVEDLAMPVPSTRGRGTHRFDRIVAVRMNKVNGVYYVSMRRWLETTPQVGIITRESQVIYRNTSFSTDAPVFTLSVIGFPQNGVFSNNIGTWVRAVEINSWGFFVSQAGTEISFDNPNAEPTFVFFVRQWDDTVVKKVVKGVWQSSTENRHYDPEPVLVEGNRLYIDNGGGFYTFFADMEDYEVSELLPSFRPASVRPGTDYLSARSLSTDLDIYDGKLYSTGSWDDNQIYETDLRQYRKPEVRPNITPQFLIEGESLPLRPFTTGAVKILFDDWESVPDYLSIDSNLNLNVAEGEITEDVCILVKLRSFGYRYETPFEFYLIIEKKVAPIWKAFETLSVDNDETVDMLSLVEGAETVQWKTGYTPPSGYTLSASGQLTVSGQVSEAPKPVEMRATGPHGSTDKAFAVQPHVPDAIVSSKSFDFRLLIEGIDVTEDVLVFGSVRHSLDVINPNQFVSDDASFTLSSDRGKYDGRVAGNFWDTHNLNKNGYLSKIEFWVDIFDTDSRQSKLLFEGLILRVQSSLNNINVVLTCIDRTYLLKNTSVAAIGLEKYSALSPVRETYQGEYKPDASVLPIVTEGDTTVVSGTAAVPTRTSPNASEGLTQTQEAYLTANGVFSSGGYLPENPLLKFRTPYQRRDIAYLIRAISEAGGFFNPKIDIKSPEPAEHPHLTSRGNVAFNVEKTKPLRTVVDWIHDPANDIFYQLLGHPSGYIQDWLVSHDPATDTYKHIKTFASGIQVVQLTSQDFENFFILATTALEKDWTEFPNPPNNDESVFDRWDSSRETEDTRILKFEKSTGAMTTLVDVDDARPAQVGLFYMAGFENERHIRLREGIFCESRSTFKIHGNHLYYRFANWNTFGVARVPVTGGTTAAMLTANRNEDFNYLNFDFDIAPNGDIYMPCAEGRGANSAEKIKKYDAATGVSSVVSNRSSVGALGCHEAIYTPDGDLYFVGAGNRSINEIDKSARAGIFRFETQTNRFGSVHNYNYVQLSCRSFVWHEGYLYFAEYPNASTHYEPSNANAAGQINSSLGKWDPRTRSNEVPPNKVWLKRIVNGKVEDVVTPWYERQAFNATAVPMLSVGGELHAIARYADKFTIAARDSDAAQTENEQWVTFGRTIRYFLEEQPSGSLYDIMTEYAKLSNTRLQFTNNRLRFDDIDPYEALLATGLSDAAGQLNYKDANKEFPSSGHVLIGSEIIAYRNRTASRLSGLTRGVGGTTAAAHSPEDHILFLDKVIDASAIEDPYSDVNINTNTNKFYNRIVDSENRAVAVDEGSVDQFGERTYTLSTQLSQHQIAWSQYLNGKTLDRLKDIKSNVRVRMEAAYYLDIGDIVMFAYSREILMPIQIIEIQHIQTGGESPSYQTQVIGAEIVRGS